LETGTQRVASEFFLLLSGEVADSVRGEALLLNSNFVSISVHLSAVGVLDEKTTELSLLIGVFDTDDVVFADHHDGESVGVGLMSTGNGLAILVDSIGKSTFLTLVVDDGPGHGQLVESGGLSIGVENLSISVGELSDNSTFFSANSSNFNSFVDVAFANKLLSSLADLSISKVLDEEAVRESKSSKRGVLVNHVFRVELIKVVHWLFFPCWLGSLGDLDVVSDFAATSLRFDLLGLVSLDSFLLGCDLLSSWWRRFDSDSHLAVTAELDLLNTKSGAVFKLKPEFSISDHLVGHKAVHLCVGFALGHDGSFT